MKVVRYAGPRAFLDAVETFLLADEACHNLLLGAPARLGGRDGAGAGAYFAVAVDHGEIAGAAMMTPPWNVVVSRTGHREAVRAFAEDVMGIQPAPPGVTALTQTAEQFAADWHDLTGRAAERVRDERIHRLDAVRPVPAVDGALRSPADADRPMVIRWLEAFAEEAFGPAGRPPWEARAVIEARLSTPGEGLVLWDDGEPRCVAGFGSETRNGIRVGPVYTPPEQRGRGFATACVAALSRRLLDGGRRFCMLYTDLANPTSNRIYRRIGYEPVCDVAEYRFLR